MLEKTHQLSKVLHRRRCSDPLAMNLIIKAEKTLPMEVQENVKHDY